jgi:5-methylcytosine-specific restriction protein A
VLCAQRGRRVRATVVDHIKPHKFDFSRGGLFWSASNHQALCEACHNGAKQSFEKTGVMRGCDEKGEPLDPNHSWNQ